MQQRPGTLNMNHDYALFRFLIIDEDESFTKLLSFMLKDLGCTNVKVTSSLKGAYDILSDYMPDIVFMDAELRANNEKGIGIGHLSRQLGLNFTLIFIASHLKTYHESQLKKVYPASFISRELSQIKLMQTLEIARLQKENAALIEKLANAEIRAKMNKVKQQEPSVFMQSGVPHIFFKIGDSYKRVDVDQISYFYADNKLTYAKVGSRNYPTNVQLKSLEDLLTPKFLRCHKKYLINIQKIDIIHIKENKLKIDEEMITIGHTYRKVFFDRLQVLK